MRIYYMNCNNNYNINYIHLSLILIINIILIFVLQQPKYQVVSSFSLLLHPSTTTTTTTTSSFRNSKIYHTHSKNHYNLFVSKRQQQRQQSVLFLDQSITGNSITFSDDSIETTVSTSNNHTTATSYTTSTSTSSYNYINKYMNMSIKAIGSSTTMFVSIIFFIILIYKRNVQMVSFFIGAICNGILSKILKKIINQTRPYELQNSIDILHKPNDNGMPSSHAMSLGFIATYIGCNIYILQVPLLFYTIISLYYRIQVKLHTWQQVLVGTIIGSINGYIWYKLCIGQNPYNIHIMNLLTKYLFKNQIQLPMYYMIVPFIVGTMTIGSFERRIKTLLKKLK